MGQLVLGVAGAVIGNIIAPGIGGAVGWAIGSLAGSLLFPQKIQGPRLEDTKVQGAEYGTMRPILFGAMRIGGIGEGQGSTANGPNKFTEHEHKSGGKGGPEVTEFSYSLSFFDAICEGPIAGVRKRWADGRLITDDSGAPSTAAWPYTLYLGDTTQTPDPTMETVYGTGEVSPMRGVAYESHEELDTTDYGNARPNVEYEAFTTAGDIPRRIATFSPWSPDPQTSHAATYDNGIITVHSHEPTAGSAPYPYNWQQWTVNGEPVTAQIVTNIEDVLTVKVSSEGFRNLHLNVGWEGSGTLLNGVPYHWIQADASGIPRVSGASISNSVEGDDVRFIPTGNQGIYLDGYLFTATSQYPPAPPALNAQIWRWLAPDGVPGHHTSISVSLDDQYSADALAMGSSNTGHLYVLTAIGGGDHQMWKFDLELNLVHFWAAGDISPTHLLQRGNFFVYNNLICFKSNVGPAPATEYVRVVKINSDYSLEDYGTPLLSVNTISQQFVIQLGKTCMGIDELGTFSLCADPDPVILGDIVKALLIRDGHTEDQIDTTDLTQEVRGFVVASQMTVHNAIVTLRKGFFFDVTEFDGKVVGRNRGHDAIATIPDGDLGAHEPGSEPPEPLETTRTPEAELPRTVFINYYDVDKDYQRGSQYWRRQVTSSQTDVTLELPISLTATEALNIAQWHMHFAWLEREQFTWFTSRKWSALTPTDVVVVRGRNIRITNKTESPSGLIKFEGVLAFAGPYTPYDPVPDGSQPGAPGGGQPTPTIPSDRAATQLVLLDIPICAGPSFAIHAAMGRFSTNPWPGATLYKSADGGVTYNAVASTTTPNIIAYVQDGILASYGAGDTLDTTVVTVLLSDPVGLTLESCTDDALAAGANACAMRNSTGFWELLQFRDATLVSTGTYELSNWLRGRHGTSTDDHAIADYLVMLPGVVVDGLESEIDVERLYKAVTFGTAIADALPVAFTNTGLASDACFATIGGNTPPFTGDEGSPSVPAPGGVPAPDVGDCAAGKFLSACGTWEVPAGGTSAYQIEIIIGDGTNPITTGLYPTGIVRIPRAGTITGWTILSCDAATPTTGAIVIDLWKDTYAGYPPDVSNTIIPSGTKPTITASANKATFANLTGWTTALAAGSIIFPNVDSVTSFKAVKLIVTYDAT